MNQPLPFSAIDALDRTIRVYRRHFAVFVRSTAGALLPFLAVWVLFAARDANGAAGLYRAPIHPDIFLALAADLPDSSLGELARAYGGGVVFFLLLHTFITNAAVQSAATLLLGSDAVPQQPAFGSNRTVLLFPAVLALVPVHLFGAVIADQIATLPPFAVAFVRNRLTVEAVPPLILSVLPPVLVAALLLFLAARLAVAAQAVLVEQHGPFGCFARSWRLTRGEGTRVWAMLALLEALIGLVASVPLVAGALLVLLLARPDLLPTVSALAAIASQAAYIVLLPLPFIATTVVYAEKL